MSYGNWILCSERLPEKMEDVLVTQIYYDLDLEEYVRNVNTACFDGDWYSVFLEDGYMEDYDVIAWMPLPEPYWDYDTYLCEPLEDYERIQR